MLSVSSVFQSTGIAAYRSPEYLVPNASRFSGGARETDTMGKGLLPFRYSMTNRASYTEYLKSPYWRAIRRRALIRAGHLCQWCGSAQLLQVHHRTYDRLGHEQPDDLTVLCDPCHSTHHGFAPSPSRGNGPVHISEILPVVLRAIPGRVA